MHYFRILGLGLLIMLSLPARAAAPTATELQALRDGSYRITTQFFMYTILERAGERRNDVERLIPDVDKRIAALSDQELSASWRAVRAAALTDPYVKDAVNQQTLYALEDKTTEFAKILEKRMPHDLDPRKKTLYELAGRMQVMMTIYLRNSADAFGGANYSGNNKNLDLPQLVQEFSSLLDKVSAKQQKELAPMFTKIHTKWIFLAPRLIDYQQNNVPYIVDLYGRQIVDMLLATASH